MNASSISTPGQAASAEGVSIARNKDISKRRHGIFTVVLTGGIASGKTAVSDCFARLGVPVVDTDQIARELVEPGQPALSRIAAQFGADFLDSEGRLDRRKMREAIFTDAEQKFRLEAILHPLIAARAVQRVAGLDSPYCILVIPLYTRSSAYTWIDRVLVVDANEKTQIQRVMVRDQISEKQALAILKAQASRHDRLLVADDVIDNSGTLAELEEQVEMLHSKYLELCAWL